LLDRHCQSTYVIGWVTVFSPSRKFLFVARVKICSFTGPNILELDKAAPNHLRASFVSFIPNIIELSGEFKNLRFQLVHALNIMTTNYFQSGQG
jgi:hypothetical protein